jgi:anti-sigma factor RsiW
MNAHVTRAELELYVLGALAESQARAVEAHCAACDRCATSLAHEARLEMAFEQVAQVMPDAGARPRQTRRLVSDRATRPARALAYGAAGVVAMAAAVVLWLGRAPVTMGEGSVAAGGQAAAMDGAALDVQDDSLDGG